MDEQEEHKPIIVECPHCYTKVIPLANNICPNCQEDVLSLVGVNPSRVPLVVQEGETFPPYCHSCGAYTERTIRVTSDKESPLDEFLFRNQPPENTSIVIVFLPECENCAGTDVELTEVDYDHQRMRLIVNRKFQEKVLQGRGEWKF